MAFACKIAGTCVLLVFIAALGNDQFQVDTVGQNPARTQTDQWRYQAVQNDDWKFEVGFVDKPYLPYETIWLELSITNISDDVQCHLFLEPGVINLFIGIFDLQGRQMYKPNIKSCPEIDIRPTIQPGERIHYFLDVQAFNHFPAEILYLHPGEYYVNVKFKPFTLDSPRLVETLDSISFPFEVEPPQGEEVPAHELFLKLLEQWKTGAITVPPIFFQLQEEFPDTRYAKFAYEFLLFRFGTFHDLPQLEKQRMAILRKRYFAKYAGQLWNPEWNKIREVLVIDSTGNWVPK